MRLQKYLAQAAIASRRRAEDLIASGAVKVNGEVVTELGMVVKERDRVEVNGKRVLRVDPVYRILLKPRECLATLAERGERPTLRRYVSNPEPGLAVVAPLDYPSEGVVLLTTDGELAAAIAKQGQKVPMTYHIKFQGAVGETEIARLTRGWRWEGIAVRPIEVVPLATTGKNTWVELVVPEIRPRAFKGVGDIIRHSVLKISRVRLGSLSFEGLAMGGWRDLTKGELADLRTKAGISKPVAGGPMPPVVSARPEGRSQPAGRPQPAGRRPQRADDRRPPQTDRRGPQRSGAGRPPRTEGRPERSGAGRPPRPPEGRPPRAGAGQGQSTGEARRPRFGAGRPPRTGDRRPAGSGDRRPRRR